MESIWERAIRKDLFQWYLATTTGGVDIRTAAMIPMTTLLTLLPARVSLRQCRGMTTTRIYTLLNLCCSRRMSKGQWRWRWWWWPTRSTTPAVGMLCTYYFTYACFGCVILNLNNSRPFPFLSGTLDSFVRCRPPPTIHPESYPNNKTNIQFGLICAPWTIRMLITTAAGDKNSTTTTTTKVESGQTWLNVG